MCTALLRPATSSESPPEWTRGYSLPATPRLLDPSRWALGLRRCCYHLPVLKTLKASIVSFYSLPKALRVDMQGPEEEIGPGVTIRRMGQHLQGVPGLTQPGTYQPACHNHICTDQVDESVPKTSCQCHLWQPSARLCNGVWPHRDVGDVWICSRSPPERAKKH